MRSAHVVAIIGVFLTGCQTGQQEAARTPGSGATSFTAGTPDTIRSDTTRDPRSAPSQSGEVTLTLDLTSYSPGATVTMRIRSHSRDTLGFNQCSSRVVERQDGIDWVAHPESGRMCTMELRLLMPNDTTTATTDLPQDVRNGTYRIVVTFSRQSSTNPGAVRAVSPSFPVR
jgi:hypothetical protein